MDKKESTPFFTKGEEMGSFEEGTGETIVKAGSPTEDPIATELRALQEELRTWHTEIAPVLKAIAKNTGPKPNPRKRNLGGR